MSSGFAVILIVATLVVIIPSALLLRVGWSSGRTGQIASAFSTLLLIALGCLVLSGTEWPLDDTEVRVVSFLGAWGILMIAAIIATGVWCALGRLFKGALVYIRSKRMELK